jgi:hypothetical protein
MHFTPEKPLLVLRCRLFFGVNKILAMRIDFSKNNFAIKNYTVVKKSPDSIQ